MNINKLFEGQRHDEEKAVELVSIVARYAHPDTRDMVWKACHEAIDQYAEHFLVKFLDIEIERLEKEKEDSPDQFYHEYIDYQIIYYGGIKRQLTQNNG